MTKAAKLLVNSCDCHGTDKKPISRKDFRELCLIRDGHKCLFCDETENLSVHHIIERRLFGSCLGQHLDNGATVCELHHMFCERTIISCDQVRDQAGITNIVLPELFYPDHQYDKWGNIIYANGMRRSIGPLFYDESVQKVLKDGGVLNQFSPWIKYPRTVHHPLSQHQTEDDKINYQFSNQILSETNGNIVITIKMDGECFPSKAEVNMADGTYKSIGNIHSCEEDQYVLGLNDKGEIVPSKVLNKFKNGNTEDWLKLTFDSPLGKPKTLICTHNHHIVINGDYKEAQEANVGDTFKVLKTETILSDIQRQIIIAKLLGDGSFSSKKDAMQYSHLLEKKEYCDWINSNLTDIYSSSCEDKSSKGRFTKKSLYKSWTKVNKTVKDLYPIIVNGKKKIFPESLIKEFTPLMLAILYMDDGNITYTSAGNPQYHFSFCDFDNKSLTNFQTLFSNFGIETSVTECKKGYKYLHISVKSHQLFSDLIAPYVVPCMKYKLPESYSNLPLVDLNSSNSSEYTYLKDYKILSKEDIKYKYTGKYDIETETHNYFVNGVLVHNSFTGYQEYCHARSLDSSNHESRNWAKTYHFTNIAYNLPEGMRYCAENLYAKHAIKYDDLESYLLAFQIWDKLECLSWSDTKLWFKLLNLKSVQEIYHGPYDEVIINDLFKQVINDGHEGIVVRSEESFHYQDFYKRVCKLVRPNFHAGGGQHWRFKKIEVNGLKQ